MYSSLENFDGTLIVQYEFQSEKIDFEGLVVVSGGDPRWTHVVNRWFLKEKYSIGDFGVWAYSRNEAVFKGPERDMVQRVGVALKKAADDFQLDPRSVSVEIDEDLATLQWNSFVLDVVESEANRVALNIKERFDVVWGEINGVAGGGHAS